MLISLSEVLDVPVSKLLGENIEEPKTDDLEVISQKLEVINLQLAQTKEANRKWLRGFLILSCIGLVLIFIILLMINGEYLNWNYNNPELAAAGVWLHGFEWIYIRVFPFVSIALIAGIIITRKK